MAKKSEPSPPAGTTGVRTRYRVHLVRPEPNGKLERLRIPNKDEIVKSVRNELLTAKYRKYLDVLEFTERSGDNQQASAIVGAPATAQISVLDARENREGVLPTAYKPNNKDKELLQILQARVASAGGDYQRAHELLAWVDFGVAAIALGKPLLSAEYTKHLYGSVTRAVFLSKNHVKQAKRPNQPATVKEGLPQLPPGVSWPTETYTGSPEARRGGGGIVAYLDRVWLPIMGAAPGLVDLRIIRHVDRSAAKGIDNLSQKKDLVSGNRVALPQRFDIPTKKEVINRQIRQAGLEALTTSPKLAQTIATRVRRGKPAIK